MLARRVSRRPPDLPVDPVAWQPVASEKRQRQDQLRAQKLEEIETQTKKAAANKKRNRLLGYGAAVLVVLVLISRPWSWGSGESADTTLAGTPTTVAGAATTLAGSATTLAGSATTLAGSATTLAGSATTVPGSATTRPGAVTTLAGSPTTVALPVAISKKPEFATGKGVAPKRLVIKDLVVGTGAEVKAGSNLSVNYVGKAWSTGAEFDSSWSRGSTFDLTNMGQAPVIKGWNEGLIGMKQGGRRELTIPPDLAYGAAGKGPIKGGETLVFVIDAVSVT